jgi:hypothetical protein
MIGISTSLRFIPLPADSNSNNNNDDDEENDGLTSRKIQESNKSWLPGALSKLSIPNATVI